MQNEFEVNASCNDTIASRASHRIREKIKDNQNNQSIRSKKNMKKGAKKNDKKKDGRPKNCQEEKNFIKKVKTFQQAFFYETTVAMQSRSFLQKDQNYSQINVQDYDFQYPELNTSFKKYAQEDYFSINNKEDPIEQRFQETSLISVLYRLKKHQQINSLSWNQIKQLFLTFLDVKKIYCKKILSYIKKKSNYIASLLEIGFTGICTHPEYIPQLNNIQQNIQQIDRKGLDQEDYLLLLTQMNDYEFGKNIANYIYWTLKPLDINYIPDEDQMMNVII